jgi:mevalonate kinase
MDFNETKLNQLYDEITNEQVKLMNQFKQTFSQEDNKDLEQQIKLLSGLNTCLIKYRNHLRKVAEKKNVD